MSRSVLAAMVAACFLAASCATTPAAKVVEGPPQPALWAVRDADSTLYLYGTIHMRKQGKPWGGPIAEAALMEADEVWTELEIDPKSEAAAQALVARYGLDPARKLSEQLKPERAQQMKALAALIGLPEPALESMKPWLASLTLTVVPMLQAGYDPQAGVDRAVDRVAESAGKRMRWFESAEEQIQFLAGFDDALQIQMLEDTLDEVQRGPALMTAMETAWETGDDVTLARDMVAPMQTDYPALYDVILKQRNAAWVTVLARELEGSGVDFVAVGAAHLVGPDSVQAMLEARGFTVERVTPPAPKS
ncbi:MAG: TraB/GumN family protein [Hyphomonadaceae bacterium]|nr:TraB/GumN family protein [Hyphomonadaceae bacterium]